MSANLFGNFLTVATIPLLILLLIIYYSKDQFNNIRSKLFKLLLYVLLSAAIIEVFLALLINYGSPKFLLEIVSRVHFALLAEWWFLYIYYLVALFDGNVFESFKELFKYNLFTKILFVYAILAGLLILIIPSLSTVDNIDVNRIEYMPKHVLFLTIFILGIALIMAIYYLIKSKNQKEHEMDRIILIVIIIGMVIFYSLQILFPYIFCRLLLVFNYYISNCVIIIFINFIIIFSS